MVMASFTLLTKPGVTFAKVHAIVAQKKALGPSAYPRFCRLALKMAKPGTN